MVFTMQIQLDHADSVKRLHTSVVLCGLQQEITHNREYAGIIVSNLDGYRILLPNQGGCGVEKLHVNIVRTRANPDECINSFRILSAISGLTAG